MDKEEAPLALFGVARQTEPNRPLSPLGAAMLGAQA